MMEDLPMVEEYPDADMAVDYDGYDYEMQEDAPPQEQMQEYDMDQADYGDTMAAETPAGMVTEVPQVPQAVVDVPIIESESLVPAPEIPIAIATEPTAPPADPIVVADAPAPAALPTPQATIAEVPASTIIPQVTLPLPTPFEAQPPPAPSPPQHQPELIVIPEIIAPPTPVSVTVPNPDQQRPSDVVDDDSVAAEAHHDVPDETAPAESNAVHAHEQPIAGHAASHPPEVALPLVTVYSDDQPFTLFFGATEGTSATTPAPVLLQDRFDLFTAPLVDLLNALQQTESELFAGVQGCVFGLEYQALDLTIDANCKYAATYTLKHLCDALVACNHPAFDFTLYQVTDFETSLHQRLQGVIPDYVIAPVEVADDAEPPQATEDLQTTLPEAEAPVTETSYEETVDVSAASAPVPEERDVLATKVEEGQGVVPPKADTPPPGLVEAAPQEPTTASEAEGDHHEEYEVQATAPEEERTSPAPVQETAQNEEGTTTKVLAEVHSQETELPDGAAEEDSDSSATLESSAHDEHQAEQDHGAVEPLRAQDSAAGEAEGDEQDEFGSDYDPNEFEDGAIADHKQSETTSGEVDQLSHASEAAEEEQDELEPEENAQLPESGLPGSVPSSAGLAPPATTSTSSEGDDQDPDGVEYEDYEDYADQFEDELETAAGDAFHTETATAEDTHPSSDRKTPPLVTTTNRSISGKRDREADDLSEYDVDDLGHESDSKRPRVE